MPLPSKWAPDGLSYQDQHRTITVGHNIQKPADYVIRKIEHRVNDAIASKCNNPHGVDEDIEMIAIDDVEEVDVISSFIDYSRNNAHHDNEAMEYEFDSSPEFAVVAGNISYLVVDTNFIISHLNILNDLKDLAEEYGLRIIIPITVVRELDGLKSSNKQVSDSENRIAGKTVGHLARWANDWIYTALANNTTVIKGQKLNQRLDKSTYQDDAILDCCLYFQQYNLNVLVILLSNDKNLCNKALTDDIKTVSFTKGMTAKLIAETIRGENIRIYGECNQIVIQTNNGNGRASPAKKVVQPSKEWIEATQNIDNVQTTEEIINTVYREIQAIAPSAIHRAMEKEYGPDLDIVRGYDHDSVTTLEDCSEVMIRFWFTVFQEHFKHLPNNFDPFHESNSGIRGSHSRHNSSKSPLYNSEPVDLEELQQFVKFWATTLQILYLGVMDETRINALEILINRWYKLAGVGR